MLEFTHENQHRVALARELTYSSGYPLRDRWGYAASNDTVLFCVLAVFANPIDKSAVDAIGVANIMGEIQLACDYDTPTGEEYELGIVQAIRPLVEDRRDAAARGLF